MKNILSTGICLLLFSITVRGQETYELYKGGSRRWNLGLQNDEAAGNVGSDFSIWRYANDGTLLGNAFNINRSNGVITTYNRMLVSGATDDGSTPLQVKGGIKATGSSYRAFTANIVSGYGTIDLAENNNRRAFIGYIAGASNSYATFGVVSDAGVENGIHIQRASGNVGIGTVTPEAKLTVNGGIKTSSSSYRAFTANIVNGYTTIDLTENNSRRAFMGYAVGGSNSYATFGVVDDAGVENGIHIQRSSGNVGIGTTVPKAKLAVNGDLFAKKIKVTTTDWPDFVFHDNYKLPALQEIEKYIVKHKHLPDIPSAKEVEMDGVDLGEINKKLLQKIEELTLHLIQQQKDLEELKDWKKKIEAK
jgi:hypothetical protein